MSNTPEGMLSGDEFSLKEWSASQGRPKSNGVITVEMQEAFEKLRQLSIEADVPMFAVFAVSTGIYTQSDLLSKPENVTAEMLMSRAMISGDPHHIMQVAMAQMQSGMKP